MSGCAQKSGFLTFFSCGEPVASMCIKCGKPVCAAHLQAGSTCPDCAVLGLSESDAASRGLESSYYGQSSFNDSDYTTFDSVQGGGGEVDGGGASGEWSGTESGSAESGNAAAGAADFQDS
jgi:uncharacterized membrane protein YgcG